MDGETAQLQLVPEELPGIDGLETLRQVKDIRPDVAVIMVTEYSLEDLIKQAMERGSFACLNKPVDMEKLMGVVEKCLAREKEADA